MKILYLCSDAGVPVLGHKGASVHVRGMVAALSRAGHHVILAAPVLNKSPWEKPEQIEATVIQIKPPRGLQEVVQGVKNLCQMLAVESSLPGELRRILYSQEMVDELAERFKNDPPDFIYERAALYGTAGVALAHCFKRPLILELNAPLAVEQSAYRGSGLEQLAAKTEQHVLAQADAVLTVSAALREHVLALGVVPEKVLVVPNGVDPGLFHPGTRDPDLRASLGIGEEIVLGFVGGLRPWHGVEILPALLESLLARQLAVRMVIVGDGQLRLSLQEDFQNRGLANRVSFTGSVTHEQTAALVRQFDVALAPYPRLEHGFYFSPLKLFEYMACGVPVVAADLGQITEVIRNGETGLLYPAGNLEALTNASAQLLHNPKQRVAFGEAGARLIRSRYTWDRNAARVAELAAKLSEAREKPAQGSVPG